MLGKAIEASRKVGWCFNQAVIFIVRKLKKIDLISAVLVFLILALGFGILANQESARQAQNRIDLLAKQNTQRQVALDKKKLEVLALKKQKDAVTQAQNDLIKKSQEDSATINDLKEKVNVLSSRGAVRTNIQSPKAESPNKASSSLNYSSGNSVVATICRVAGEYGLSSPQMVEIARRESSLTPGVVNKYGFAGLFQMGSMNEEYHSMILGNAESEARAGCHYVCRKYGSSERALSFWRSNGWY